MMATLQRFTLASALAGSAALVMSGCGGGGGYGSNSSPTAPSGSTANTPTVTIRAGGTLDPQEIRISVGQQVRFVNEDTGPHHPQSNPHLAHTDCPEANISLLNPGQSATTSTFGTARVCGYHDHIKPDTTRLHGTIRIGGAEGPSGPVYVVHQ